jgi:hypothetical protein
MSADDLDKLKSVTTLVYEPCVISDTFCNKIIGIEKSGSMLRLVFYGRVIREANIKG